MFIKHRISYKQFLPVFLSGQSFQCLLCRLEDRCSDALLQYFLSSCTVHNLGKFLLVSGSLNASKRLNCVFLFTINLHSLVNLHVSYLCILQPRTSKTAIPGDIVFKVIPKLTARVFIKFKSSCSSHWNFVSKTLHRLSDPSLVYLRSQNIRVQLIVF